MKIGGTIYNVMMLPLEAAKLHSLRKKLVTQARGVVLEIGAGTGINLSYYRFNQIKKLIVTDLSLAQHKACVKKTKEKIICMEESVEKLSLADKSVDTVMFTLVFCSVDNPLKGLSEVRRVLKDNGKIIFIEHVLPKKKTTKKIFYFVNKGWMKISRGCNLTRETIDVISQAGFNVTLVADGVFSAGWATKKEG
ncbi:MAG: class I SAM-dependent methyltransferase [Clostridiales bacterium]|nr:class I SAM-dependent methyltransferase [Clostridiales bacterium]